MRVLAVDVSNPSPSPPRQLKAAHTLIPFFTNTNHFLVNLPTPFPNFSSLYQHTTFIPLPLPPLPRIPRTAALAPSRCPVARWRAQQVVVLSLLFGASFSRNHGACRLLLADYHPLL